MARYLTGESVILIVVQGINLLTRQLGNRYVLRGVDGPARDSVRYRRTRTNRSKQVQNVMYDQRY